MSTLRSPAIYPAELRHLRAKTPHGIQRRLNDMLSLADWPGRRVHRGRRTVMRRVARRLLRALDIRHCCSTWKPNMIRIT
jgi:hypothetical protein